MHYIPSHTAKFSRREEAIFKKTLKIRVATKRAAACQARDGSFPFLFYSFIYFPKSLPFLCFSPLSGFSPRITASKFRSASF